LYFGGKPITQKGLYLQSCCRQNGGMRQKGFQVNTHAIGDQGRSAKATSRTADMHVLEKSDCAHTPGPKRRTNDLCGLRYQPPRIDHSGRRLKMASGIDLIAVMI
jgi:hypothetical protein